MSSTSFGEAAGTGVDEVPQSVDEAGYVRAARRGDRVGFAVLVDLYWERIRRWLFVLTHDVERSEDLTQEVFVKVWQKIPELEDIQLFRAWIFRIARNLAADSRRNPRSVATRAIADEAIQTGSDPVAAILEMEGQRQLQAAIDRLPARYRLAFLLWTREELSYAEIASTLDVSEVTARWCVCKAREFLFEQMKSYLDGATS